MFRLASFIASGLLLLSAQLSIAQELWLEMKYTIEKLDLNPIAFQLHGQRMLEHGMKTGNCDSLCMSEFLLKNAAIDFGGESFDSTTTAAWALCNCKASPLAHTRGYLAFSAKRNEEAIEHFQEAAQWAEEENIGNQCVAFQALGSAYMKEYEYEAALKAFERSYLIAPHEQNPTNINNLAFTSFIMGNCDEALDFTDLGQERLDEMMLDRPDVAAFFRGERNVLRLTRLQVLLDLGLTEEAGQTFNAIRIENGFNGREAVATSILTSYAQLRNDLSLFKAILPGLEGFIKEDDITDWPALLGANLQLFQPFRGPTALEDAWTSALEVPEPFRGGGLQPGLCREATVQLSSGTFLTKQNLLIAIISLAAGFFFLAIYILRLSSSLSTLRQMAQASTPTWISAINYALDPSQRMTSEDQKRAQVAFNHLKRNELIGQLPGSDKWTEMELEVAKGLWAGEHTKAMAARLDVSVSTLYKVRHRLRQKLHAPQHASLTDWIRKQSRFKVILCLVAMRLLFSAPLYANGPVLDSLKSILKQGDFTAWQRHINDVQAAPNFEEILKDVPPPFHWAYLPAEQRPSWAQIPDSTLWHWQLSGLERLELWSFQSDALGIAPFDPNPMSSFLRKKRTATFEGILVALTLGVLVLLVVVWRLRQAHLRMLQPHESYMNQPIWEALSTAQVTPEALNAWKSLLSQRSMQHHDSGLWALLTNSEKEVAMRLAEGIAVGEIAKAMACSESYIYNIRSTIRRKWELKPDEDLVEAIRRIYDRDGIQF